MSIILPKGVPTRWQQCHANNKLLCWRAMWHWLSAEALIASTDGLHEMADDLRMLSDMAFRYMLDLQPKEIAA